MHCMYTSMVTVYLYSSIVYHLPPLLLLQGMEYLHGRGIPHGLLSSHSISLPYRVIRVCISLAPQYSRSKARQLEPQKVPYLPPECIRELRASRCRSRDTSCDNEECGRRRVHSCGDEVWAPTERRVCMMQLKGRPTLAADVFAFGYVSEYISDLARS